MKTEDALEDDPADYPFLVGWLTRSIEMQGQATRADLADARREAAADRARREQARLRIDTSTAS